MKTFLVIIGILFFFSGIAYGQTWYTANQVTVQWDAVTELSNGDPVPAGDIIRYKVWLKNAVTGGEPVELAEIAELEYTITLNTEGKYFAGVSALRYTSENILLNESTISWSDVAECTAEGPFGIQYFLPLKLPGGLRKK
ncbi:MAG: hypothetical protein WBC50_10290 [Dehalococcoidales bacterium]